MNERTGKLLVFFGLFISLIITTATRLIYFFGLFLPEILKLPLNLANIASSIFVVLGFLIVFLAKRRLLDLLITVAFAIAYVLNYAQSSVVYDPYTAIESGITTGEVVAILSLITLIPYALWFIKLMRTTYIGAISVLVSVLVPIFVPSIIAKMVSPASPLFLLLVTLETVGLCALRTFAAYLDMKN